MKTARLSIGIISIVLFAVILFQSCAAGLGEALEGTEEGSGSLGTMVAFCFLIAGIVGVCTRKGVGGGFVSAAIYALGGLCGLAGSGTSFGDLVIWGSLSLIFAVIFIIGAIVTKKRAFTKENAEKEE